MKIKQAIPNLLTLGNMLCGLSAIVLLLMPYSGSPPIGIIALLLLFAMIFDFLDGLVARMLNVSSPLGKELDSFSDLVSFGVVPGLMVFFMIKDQLVRQDIFIAMDQGIFEGLQTTYVPWWHMALPFTALLIPALSALRLAKFNLDTRQSYGFLGLPTPMNAAFFFSIFLMFAWDGTSTPDAFAWLFHPYALAALSIVMSILLITEIPLIAFKFKDYSLKSNWQRYLLIIISLILLPILHYRAIPLIFAAYFIVSLIDHFGSQKA